MDLYKPETDGFAAGSGFRNEDIIRGLEECTVTSSTETDGSRAGSSSPAIHRELVRVDGLDSSVWSRVASSCERLQPSTPIRMVVERRRPQ